MRMRKRSIMVKIFCDNFLVETVDPDFTADHHNITFLSVKRDQMLNRGNWSPVVMSVNNIDLTVLVGKDRFGCTNERFAIHGCINIWYHSGLWRTRPTRSPRRNGQDCEEMGSFSREEQILLQWKDHDGQTGGSFLFNLCSYHHH